MLSPSSGLKLQSWEVLAYMGFEEGRLRERAQLETRTMGKKNREPSSR
jgi:hypothetical protein